MYRSFGASSLIIPLSCIPKVLKDFVPFLCIVDATYTFELQSTAVQGWTIGVQLDGLVSLQDCLAALEWEHNVMRIGIDAISQCPAESPQASRRLDLDQDGAEPSLTQGQGEAKPLPAEDPMEATLYGLGNGSESPHICPGQTVVTAALKKIVEPTPLHSAPLAPDLHGGASQRKGK